MPFSPLFQIEYEKIIQPSLLEINIECVRGDEIYTKQRIIDDIWNSIKKCRFVIAELTEKNPNVLYEVGLAHAIGKPVIILTRNSDDVPFDLKALRYLFYDTNDPFWGENLKKGIQNLATKVLETPELDKYLDGITNNKIAYPKIPNKIIKPKIKGESFAKLSGTWYGEFTNQDTTIHKVTLQIDQEIDLLIGTAVISFIKGSKPTVVQEILNGSIKINNMVELHGVNYTYLDRGLSINYALDSFQLLYHSETNSLSGEVSSNLNMGLLKTKIDFKILNSR